MKLETWRWLYLGDTGGASPGSKDRETSEESSLTRVCWERLMESPLLRPAGNKERELRVRERTQGICPTVSSSVRREGSTKPTSQGQTVVAPRQEGRASQGEPRAPIAGAIFVAFWPVLF